MNAEDAAPAVTPAPAPAPAPAHAARAPRAAITPLEPTAAEMAARTARFGGLVPTDDYVDASLPGCARTTWRVIGTPGTAPGAAPIEAEGFHMNLVRCEPGQGAPLHSHLTQEVFFALEGRWEVSWGPEGASRLVLERFDTVSIPPGVCRGFRNIGETPGLLMGLASGRDPGMIDWPPTVRDAAAQAGVVLP